MGAAWARREVKGCCREGGHWSGEGEDSALGLAASRAHLHMPAMKLLSASRYSTATFLPAPYTGHLPPPALQHDPRELAAARLSDHSLV